MAKEITDKETRAWVGLVHAQQILVEKVERDLKQQGLPPLGWYDVLWELERTPGGMLRLNDLGKRVLLSKYNVTRLVQRLDEAGLVKKECCTQDGRGIVACITPKGKKLRKKMWPVYQEALRKHFLANYNKTELDLLTKLVNRIASPD